MFLVDAVVQGFRRFGGESPHKLLVDARMVCIIGANEAGKSSLLKVLEGAHEGTAIDRKDRTRRERIAGDVTVVELHYRLDPEDQAAISDLYVGQQPPRWWTVAKTAGGTITVSPDQRARRDRAARTLARETLTDDAVRVRLTATSEPDDDESEVEPVASQERLDEVIAILDDERGTIPSDELNDFKSFVDHIRASDELALADVLDAAEARERQPHPQAVVRDRLWRRTPSLVSFQQRDRELDSEYDLEAVADDPPVALANLARLAGLDLEELLSTVQDGETGTAEYLERLANERLAEVFAVWSQRPQIKVTINMSGMTLLIHVTTGTDVPMRLEERSDGLRQFVALVAASAQGADGGPPILLIDEIETHLHYDAQADLLSVLGDQTQSTGGSTPPIGQIVYTTHSAACLPDDLGSVRVADASTQRTRSSIRNQFWTDEPGLGPLLMAMGAATLAFVPRRAALVAEGPSELILLPTLIRESIDVEHLGYQVAPGASTARPGSIIGFDLQAPRTAWVIDSDEGGSKIGAKLIRDGIDPKLIFALGGDGARLMLESLIDVDAYRDAVAAYLADKGSDAAPPTAEDLAGDRPRTVAAHCEALAVHPPSKVIIANRLLAMRSERQIVAHEHKNVLRDLHDAVSSVVQVGPTLGYG